MSDTLKLSQPDGRVMTPEIAALIVDLTSRLDDAYRELDEANAEAADVREQRAILLQQRHEDIKAITRQRDRIAVLSAENRSLREQADAWARVAA